jgi:biotin carboxylase
MSKVMIVCPTKRDFRELGRISKPGENIYVSHDYATEALEDLTAPEAPADITIDDPEKEIDLIIKRCRDEKIDAVVSTDDYPGCTLAAIAARELDLPGVTPRANLLCQEKFLSRQIQHTAAPDAVPRFYLIDTKPEIGLPLELAFPVFVKPVKSFLSVGAERVDSPPQLAQIQEKWGRANSFFKPFDSLLRRYAGHEIGTKCLLAEELLTGLQSTLDGYVYKGAARAMGVVDSIMFPGTIAFRRFEYPSQLPEDVQARMLNVADRVMRQMGFDNGQFNMEFMYDVDTDALRIIEINARMSSQFADLFEKVDGTNSYNVMLDLALGRQPQVQSRKGRYAAAASCVLRTFQNQKVLRVPTQEIIDKVIELYPDARIEVLARAGKKLSQQMQDGCSFRYGIVNLGGADQREIAEHFDRCAQALRFEFEPV